MSVASDVVASAPALVPVSVRGRHVPADGGDHDASRSVPASTAPLRHTPTRPSMPPGASLVLALAAAPSAGASSPLLHSASDACCGDLPLRHMLLPPPSEYVWPNFDAVCWFENWAAFRDAWSEDGAFTACSVSPHVSFTVPRPGDVHYVGTAELFWELYPHPIRHHQSHVMCGPACLANRSRWNAGIVDGSILSGGEQIVWARCVGWQCANEQPATAYEFLLGPPSFATSAWEHVDPADSSPVAPKTWLWWTRGCAAVPLTAVASASQRGKRPNASNPEWRMLLRSRTPVPLARAHVAVWRQSLLPAGSACQLGCRELHSSYVSLRRDFHFNYRLWASTYAPVITEQQLRSVLRPRMLIAVVITIHLELYILQPLDAACFGIEICDPTSIDQGISLLATFFAPMDAPPLQLAMTRDPPYDLVVAFPCPDPPSFALVTSIEYTRALESGVSRAWCAVSVLHRLPAHVHALLAFERLRALFSPAPHSRGRLGIWDHARPLVSCRAARQFRDAPECEHAHSAWDFLLRGEPSRGAALRDALCAADVDGLLAPFIASVTTAADLCSEIPCPPQGLPTLHHDLMRLVPLPEPPLPIVSGFLARIPPQSIPLGCPTHVPWVDLVRGWARRLLCSALDTDSRIGFTSFDDGDCDLPAHDYVCVGVSGAGKHLPHADGVGSWNALSVVWERVRSGPHEGLFRVADFTALPPHHMNFRWIMAFMGFDSDKELISFLFHGFRWKIEDRLPMQFRIDSNRKSLRTRARGVSAAKLKLAALGFLRYRRLARRGERLDPNGPCPFDTLPSMNVAVGGADKDGLQKRAVGDLSSPRPSEAYERNAPHSDPDGPEAVSMNNLTGPKHTMSDWDGPPPVFPDSEQRKMSIRDIYRMDAVMIYIASVCGTVPCGARDDIKSFFNQFWYDVAVLWTMAEFLVLQLDDGEEWFCVGQCLSMHQGGRPASKVACRFSEKFAAEWRVRMHEWVHSTWLPTQSDDARALLRDRAQRVGPFHAVPFAMGVYTDDFRTSYACVRVAAHGQLTLRLMARECNLLMSSKVGCGTVVDTIGGRSVITGGFGCLSPFKRSRFIAEAADFMQGALTREEATSTNSYAVHVCDILAFNRDHFSSMWIGLGGSTPLSAPHIPCEAAVRAYHDLLDFVQSRSVGPFLCAIPDAPALDPDLPTPTVFAHSFMDACTEEPAGCFGHLGDLMWFFPLTGPWLDKPITVTESMAVGIQFYQFRRVIEEGPEHIVHSDATTALAVLVGRPGCENTRYVSQRFRSDPLLAAAIDRSWALHCAGILNGFADAGSRSRFDELFAVGAAMGRKLRWVRLNADALSFAHDVLHNTEPRPAVCSRCFKLRGVYVGLTVCPSCSEGDGPLSCFALDDSPLAGRTALTLRSTGPPVSRSSLLESPSDMAPVLSRQRRSPAAMPLEPHHVPASDLSPTPPRRKSPRQRRDSVSRTLDLSPELPMAIASRRPCASPQPLTAAAARARAGLAIAEQLASDTSSHALFPNDSMRLRAECVALSRTAEDGIPFHTRKSDEWGYKWFVQWAQNAGHPWMCPRVSEPRDELRLEIFYAMAVRFIAQHMRPSPRKAEVGANRGQPHSALNAAYAYRRVQQFCGRQVPCMSRVSAQISGLNQAYKRDFGINSLVREHARQISASLFAQFLRVLATCSVPDLGADESAALLVAMAYARSTGARKDEWTRSHRDDKGFLRRSHFIPSDSRGLPIHRPMTEGDYLKVIPGESKTDQDNMYWGDRPMWFRYDSSQPWGLAYRWQTWEESFPCPVHLRDAWPAFSPDGRATPFASSRADHALRLILTHLSGSIADAKARRITWHSFRVTLARAIVEGGHGGDADAIAQALVRWRTLDSVRLYGQLSHVRYADLVEHALNTDVSLAEDAYVPMCSPEQLSMELDGIVDPTAASTQEPPPSSNEIAPVSPRLAESPSAAPTRTHAHTHACAHTSKPRRTRVSTPTTERAVKPRPVSRSTPPTSVSRLTPPTPVSCPTPPTPVWYDLGSSGKVRGRHTDAHGFIGRTILVPNIAWDVHACGATQCEVVAYAPSVRCGDHMGAYVLRASDDLLFYPFDTAALRSFGIK